MLSNSDCKDMFFDELYSQYAIERVWASRSVNANASKRGRLTEILVHNYQKTKKVESTHALRTAIVAEEEAIYK